MNALSFGKAVLLSAVGVTATSWVHSQTVDSLLLTRSLELLGSSSDRVLEQLAVPALSGPHTCQPLSLGGTQVLSLSRATELILCRSPNLRQALEAVREQAAGVDLAYLAWRPRFNAALERASNRIPSSNDGSGSLSGSLTGSLGVSWVIFDFGTRNANFEQARYGLTSAIAVQDAATLSALREALRLYVEASSAWAKLEALEQAEQLARQSAETAQTKYVAQVGSLSEKLQAQTALAQATLERVRANGAWRVARAALAIALGLPSTTALRLPSPADAFPDLTTQTPTQDELALVREQHPRVRALRADVSGLLARLESVRADSKGTLSLSGSLAGTRQLGANAAGTQRSLSTSLLASVPLFNSAEQKAREAQVQAQINARSAALEAIQRDVDAALGLAAAQLEIENEGQVAADSLLATATQGYEVALGRYKAGVGAIVELLTAQSALSNARALALQAQISRANAHVALAISAGRLGATAR